MRITRSTDLEKPKDYELLRTPLWGNVLYPASLNLLSAPPKAGKSSVLYSWAGKVSRGEAWGDIKPPRPLKIVYFELENPEILQYQKVQGHANDNLWISRDGWKDEFEISKVPPLLFENNIQPDILVVDPLVMATRIGHENDSRDMVRAMKKYLEFARNTRIAVILVHHDRKPPPGQGMDDPRWSARGSSALPGIIDVQLNIILGRFSNKLQVTISRWGKGPDYMPTFVTEYDDSTQFVTAKRWE